MFVAHIKKKLFQKEETQDHWRSGICKQVKGAKEKKKKQSCTATFICR